MNQTELSYRKTAVEGASAIGLVIALYDTLAGDLQRAAKALRANDIEERCLQLNHAAIVLGQLEAWVDLKNGGELAQNLASLYAYLRSKMMEAAATKSPTLLEDQMELLLQVRTAWQERDVTPQILKADVSAIKVEAGSYPSTPLSERVAFTISA